MKDVLILGAPPKTEERNNLYRALEDLCKLYAKNVSSPIDTARFKGTDQERYALAQEKIKRSYLIISEQSEVSTGQGLEIGTAIALNKSIVVIAKKGSKVSGLVKGGPMYKLLYYNTFEDIREELQNILNLRKEQCRLEDRNRKTVLITGSSRGLGRALAIIFSKEDYDIILHGRDIDALDAVRGEVLKNRVNCDIVVGDLSEERTLDKLADTASKKNLKVLINNAAVLNHEILDKNSDREIDFVISTNLIAPIKLTKRIVPQFQENKAGMIININSSVSLYISGKNETIYGASKLGLKGFTDALRKELVQYKIRVLNVYPAGMKTTMWNRAGGKSDLDKCMDPDEVAQVIFNHIHDFNSLQVDELMLDRLNR